MGSTRPKPPGVTEIFSEYVRQRKSGRSQQQVVEFLKPVLARLRQDARQQLIALLRSWEAREGAKYNAAARRLDPLVDAAELTAPPKPGEDLSWMSDLEQNDASALGQPEANSWQLNTESPVHPSVMSEDLVQIPEEEMIYCPACGRANRKQDVYCFACGEVLVTSTISTRSLDPGTEDLRHVSKTYFGRSSALLLHVRNHDRPILVRIQDKNEILIGRSSQKTGTIPDVDLSPYSASEAGVSRQHARLKFQDNTITITDLGSVNHTYINGQRLHAHEVRVLRDGDEIRLGRLSVRVAFQHMVGRLK
ncbi:MAG: FHA domain-containing protein [Anaerolineae bacterium]|nr:FHA domain-containing protein [Anaerolineae bacterium]